MSLEATFDALRRELARLREAVSALHITVTEDKPARGATVLVDHLDNLVMDLAGLLEEAEARAAQALEAHQPNGSLDPARAVVREVHELANRFSASYVGELAAHDRLARLLAMGRERGREWREWSQEVKTAIDRCARPMQTVTGALLECWSELAERLARTSVSLTAAHLGQQVSVREDRWELAGKAPGRAASPGERFEHNHTNPIGRR